MNPPRDRTGNTIREGLTIVVGVLVALLANAWWSSHMDRRREREYLVQLTADLALTETRLDEALIEESRTAEGIKRIREAFKSRQPISVDSVARWSGMGIVNYSDPRLVMGTITALQQTGDLNLIRKPHVRKAVSAYATSTAEDWAEFSRFIDYALAANLHRAVLRRTAGVVDGSETRVDRASELIKVKTDPEVQIALSELAAAVRNRIIYLKHIRQETDALLKLTQNAAPQRR